MTPRLAARGLACAYGARTVLEGFDLVAEPGTITVLLGPNGAGKSTALRALARLLPPRAGAVTLDGREIWRLPRRSFVREVAFLPQIEVAAWPMTVEQLVLLGRLPHRGWLLPYSARDHEAVAVALAQVELTDLVRRDLDSLSGGERRRAMLARALAQEARVLLLDEPGAHLDLRHQTELFLLLRRLTRERGVAVVSSLHDLNLAAIFADRAVLLSGGRVLAQGAPREVMTPELLRAAFGIAVEVIPHPRNGAPLILPVFSEAGAGKGLEAPAGVPAPDEILRPAEVPYER
ncbi:MAG TPA: ABC transporter ATP-binding protein [Thermoanaerobaculia bacterium]|nr:ABC transporter ATP-binding protein [Thermoanaerobaculia bacterium]